MPILTNPRHEAFAQALAKGCTADEAYRLAGYKPNRGNATVLKAHQSISKRVSEILAKAEKQTLVTIQTLTEELEEARAIAIAERQSSAAVAATMGKAKLHGHLVEKRQHSGFIGTYDLTKLSDNELDRLENILGPLALAGGDQGGETQTGE